MFGILDRYDNRVILMPTRCIALQEKISMKLQDRSLG
ncbi:hypothetical protein WP3W19E03_40690 [Aeromonas veronii]|uniref:Uncharacterized protein n=1 Tax=Aeromonas veronii TaxID=654 RepID=A0A6S5C7T9_AERVE|nr:hypothetical protein WP3W19E03_40690 [Aeromonas veronii]